MSYEVLDVRPMTKRIGAEIFGVDLTDQLGNQAVSEIHDALMQHQVIFFRDQPLDHESHKRLGRAFGPLAIHSGVAGIDGHKELVAIHADAPRSSPSRRFTCERRVKLAGRPFWKSLSELYVNVP